MPLENIQLQHIGSVFFHLFDTAKIFGHPRTASISTAANSVAFRLDTINNLVLYISYIIIVSRVLLRSLVEIDTNINISSTTVTILLIGFGEQIPKLNRNSLNVWWSVTVALSLRMPPD